ncbi:MAG: restriction endonuclease subunit S, partial [Bacteroidaceae bacterium]|nr:restriction endonuclease subunit S [Bacteroidaceae bacterium]
MPFEIPESWEWVTIEDVTVNRDAERIPVSLSVRKKQQNKVYDYYGAAGVIDKVENYIFDERLLLVGEDGANLLSRSKNNAFFADGKYWVNNHAHVLDCPNKSVLDYIAFVINSMSLEDYITGSAQPKLTQDNLNKISIPLPPEKEQHRIIESVNYYFSNITLLEGEIKETTSFIQKAKSKILDLAIHGKLVPQDPNDEPAIELLKRINSKFTPCDNAHYENIPPEWILAKVEDIGHLLSGRDLTNDECNMEDLG